MTKLLVLPLLLAGAALAGTAGRVPVLVELFTSEGCSSCPPADLVLQALDRQPVAGAELIVLSEHVDYWNSLGWRDPYSSALFSERQEQYADRLHSTVYTPQMVIDGRFQALGSDRGEVLGTIGEAMRTPRLPVTLRAERSGGGASVHVDAETGGAAAELFIVTAQDHARTQVPRGENKGHTLTHVAVAKSMVKVGAWRKQDTGKDIQLAANQLPAEGTGVRVIAILLDPRNGQVLGSAETRIQP